MTQQPAAVRCWKFERWPAIDQALWKKGCEEPELFDEVGRGSHLAADSLRKTAKGYGRWLSFLDGQGWFDPLVSPADRISRQRLVGYFQHLKLSQNRDSTIVGRFNELAMAMKILEPGEDMSWIRRPAGSTIRSLLPMEKRFLLVPDGVVLVDWAFDIMDRAERKPTERERLCAFRDGLLLGMLSYCGRRLRSISLLRVGHELQRIGDDYWIELSREQVKSRKPDFFPLDKCLTRYINRYLSEIRPALLRGKDTDTFWISARGGVWTPKAIQSQVLLLSERRFGTAFGPHRFRHVIATTAPRLDPSSPGLSAGVLAISEGVAREAYDRSTQIEATRNYQSGMLARREAALALRGNWK